MNLLLVDDEIFVIQGILDSVRWEYFDLDHIFTANSYAQAVNIFLNNTVDIVFCDIEMPYGTGIDLVTWIKKHSPDTECIFLTCHDKFVFAQQAVQLNCLDYILKPAVAEKIEGVLRKAVNIIKEKHRNEQYRDYGRIYMKTIGNGTEHEESIGESAVEKVARYIQEHISDSLSVNDLARLVNLNVDYLTRSFKKRYNVTPIEYIREQRIFLAKELLMKNELSISMVAAKVGYGNYSYFTKIFKSCCGVTPREFQQEYLRVSSRKNQNIHINGGFVS